jgi:hypothetical protein
VEVERSRIRRQLAEAYDRLMNCEWSPSCFKDLQKLVEIFEQSE